MNRLLEIPPEKLTDEQKTALLAVYRSYVAANRR